jgi:cytochrome P450
MREIAQTAFERWPLGEAFALHPWMQEITLDVILRTVFGIDEADRFERLRARIVELLTLAANPLVTFPPMLLRIDPFRAAPWSRRAKLKREIDAMIYEEIAQRRRRAKSGSDVLSMMLEARDEHGRAMTDVELRDELVTLLIAGHETTATTLAWAFERLLCHPSELDRLRADIAAGRDDHLDAVIKETLRVRPIVPLVARFVREPFELGGWTIPTGVRIAPCIYLVHRRADVYAEPERFVPERWFGLKPDPYAWLPFGGAIRRCLGMAFAMFEMRVVLSAIIPRARMRLADGPASMVRRGIMFAPSGGTCVVLDARLPRHAEATAA